MAVYSLTEYLESIEGHEEYDRENAPLSEYRWYAYSNGNCSIHDSREQAELAGKLVERFCVNKEEVDRWYKERDELYDLALKLRNRDLRKEFNIPENLFNLCQNKVSKVYADEWSDEYLEEMEATIEFVWAIKRELEL